MTDTVKLTKNFLLQMAKDNGVKNAAKLRKGDLIRAIQAAEGNQPCFEQIPGCTIEPCLFRGECIK